MSIAATIWLILQWLIIISVIFAALALIIALFHPLRFQLNLRGSIKGQRAELWFFYLFRLLKIGVIATPHTQDVVLKIWFWEKLLQRNQRRRKPSAPTDDSDIPPKPGATTEQADEETATSVSSTEPAPHPPHEPGAETAKVEEPIEEKSEPTVIKPESTSDSATEAAEQDSIATESHSEASTAETKTEAQVKEPEEADTPRVSQPEDSVSEKTTEEPPAGGTLESAESADSADIDRKESIAPISDIDPFAKEQETQKDQQQKTSQPGFRQKLRNIKQRISKKYQQGKKWLRFVGRKYKLLKPIFLKFWSRARQAFRIENPAIMCRYALQEPFLTGMFQGNLAIVSGVLQRFGVNFVPVPVFGAPTIYAKAKAGAVIRPWRMVLAVIALFFEKTLWKESYKLFIWYKNTKST